MSRMPRRINVNGLLYEAVEDQPEVHVWGRDYEAVIAIDYTPFIVRVIDAGDIAFVVQLQSDIEDKRWYINSIFSIVRNAYNLAKDLANSIALAKPSKSFKDLKHHHIDRTYKLVTEEVFRTRVPSWVNLPAPSELK